jgi:hypothetical protein
MALVIDTFLSLLPSRSRSGPSGWITMNAACCHHRGHRPDQYRRAGILLESGIVYNCFNCKYTTGWKPGYPLGEKFKTLCRWLGADDATINKMIFESLKSLDSRTQDYSSYRYSAFEKKSLPQGSMSLAQWSEQELSNDTEEKLSDVLSYVVSRGHDPLDSHFFWTPDVKFFDRVIIPFCFNGETVGYTARKIKDGRPKYISDTSANYVFNCDQQQQGQRYILVTEGPFDAISVDGCALLTNSISEQQSKMLKEFNSEIIVIPDQDQAGLNLFDQAAEYGFSIAVPNWEDDVKDCSDAAARYGKLFVVVDAVMTAQRGAIRINVAKKKLEQKLSRSRKT